MVLLAFLKKGIRNSLIIKLIYYCVNNNYLIHGAMGRKVIKSDFEKYIQWVNSHDKNNKGKNNEESKDIPKLVKLIQSPLKKLI